MHFIRFFSIFLVLVILHIANSSAKKSHGSNPSSQNSDIEAKKKDLEVDDEVLSSEIQQLKELASKESGSIILTTKKPKHARRKNKHHNRRRPHGSGRSNKKPKTRPTDILKADDEVKKNNQSGETTVTGAEVMPKKQRTRTRGSRHLEFESRSEIEGSKTHDKYHHRRQHRRLRAHHNKNARSHKNRNGDMLVKQEVENILHNIH